MNSKLEEICTSLVNLADNLMTSHSDLSNISDVVGWTGPPLNKEDLANIAKKLAERIKATGIEEIDPELMNIIEDIPDKIETFHQNLMSYLFNGSYFSHALVGYFSLINFINEALSPIFTWEAILNAGSIPRQLANKIRSIQNAVDHLTPDKEKLEEQIKIVQDAYEAAQKLPIDLEYLIQSRAKVEKDSSDSSLLFDKTKTANEESDKILGKLKAQLSEAEKIVAQCDQAYRIATTEGLAASFEQRRQSLTNSLIWWVAGLLIALGGAIWIGHDRFEIINKALDTEINTGKVWVQISLSILGLGAPIWFAWIATKQINQRFRLSEDYAFKASVAKAYEGYRKEAARLDEAFESRLFESALSRLEEAPLRLVDNDHYNSPIQELMDSAALKDFWATFPEAKEAFFSKFGKRADSKRPKAEPEVNIEEGVTD